eukprot:CAMPEP_0172496018 /NCGR_PEP_ID=MMETSP1066-20121228/79960_1 /TAXON_ID=671091 /ORGANISM="Coscinodiscus wailesii, Strain CCMP2513" /LENGTH=187 /DNA_ID=CAMNT_0013268069 /DNA_START=6 /DNA_END=569 /DNA_ORIENTATION=+
MSSPNSPESPQHTTTTTPTTPKSPAAAPPPPTTTTGTTSSSNNSIEFEPPLACVRRLLKSSLPSTTNVGKDASSAFARACGIFVIYITTCANDFARENKRQTITANDVLAAVKELDFDEFTPELTKFLERHRADEKTKKEAKKAAEGNKKNAKKQKNAPPKDDNDMMDDDGGDMDEGDDSEEEDLDE